ncbi:NTP transferase domain-containing protein [Nesterenkonia flava]|uniref:NTP transferase domain-containing protein n=1 Tax=Nesterenkonia flava TaxID=469799 RepID=A0ABU1FRI2_9MICC|nr:NTP transferase domain-containing protein [Nesterenkonia flava]MDR5711233.1 NTP transferase domain-containing protein [Nesterenkonia flava]
MQIILLAGGRGSRLGGVNKALLRRSPELAPAPPASESAGSAPSRPPLTGPEPVRSTAAGPTLLQQWVSALAARDITGVVVGDAVLGEHLPPAAESGMGPPLVLTREDPPFAGPAAAVCAGVRALPTPADPAGGQVMLCAVDIAEPAPLLDWLLEAARSHPHTAVLPRDGAGRDQWLASIVEARWLRERVAEIPPGEEEGQSLRWLLSSAQPLRIPLPAGLGHDIDDPHQARRFGVQL